jgi:hypothetical protein
MYSNNIKPVSSFKYSSMQSSNPMNVKTRLCKNLSNCMFGESCHYAHAVSQIVIVDCAYGDNCIFIENDESGNYVNTDIDKICFFKHPSESDDDYHFRVGNTKPPIKHVKESVVVNPIKLNIEDGDVTSWVTVGHKNSKRSRNKPTVSKNSFMNLHDDGPIHVSADKVIETIEDVLERGVIKVELHIYYE